MSNEQLRHRLEECQLSMAARGQLDEHLPPHLWERLRQRLQGIYRKATGEPMAVLVVEDRPSPETRAVGSGKYQCKLDHIDHHNDERHETKRHGQIRHEDSSDCYSDVRNTQQSGNFVGGTGVVVKQDFTNPPQEESNINSLSAKILTNINEQRRNESSTSESTTPDFRGYKTHPTSQTHGSQPTPAEYVQDALENDGILYGPGSGRPLGLLAQSTSKRDRQRLQSAFKKGVKEGRRIEREATKKGETR